MKQKLLNSLRLQLCTIVACLLCAFNGQAWGEEKTITLDFEDNSIPGTLWDSNNFVVNSDPVTTHSSFCASTGGKSTAVIKYRTLIPNVKTISVEATRTSKNTNGTMTIEFSTNGSNWDATQNVTINRNSWTKSTLTLDNPTDGYVRIYFSGTTAEKFIDNIVITYEEGPTKTDPELTFSAETATATIGQSFTAPTLTNTHNVSPITWTSSNLNVATVSNGTVTLVGEGETTISASFEGNDEYLADEASYTLTVTDPSIINLWSEDFGNYSADDVPSGGTYGYSCVNGTSITKIYTQNTLAGGEGPELLVGKNGGTFTAVVPLNNASGSLTLTYRTNAKSMTVSTTTAGIEGSLTSSNAGIHTLTFTGVTTSMTSITIVFAAGQYDNVRLDDIELRGRADVYAVEAPSFSINGGTYYTPQTVSLTCATEGATIKYSFDGESWETYSNALTISETKTIYAKAIKDDHESTVTSIEVTIAEKRDVVFNITDKTLAHGESYKITRGDYIGRDVQSDGMITLTADNAVVTIDNLDITAAAVGTATITISVQEGETYKAGNTTFTVTVAAPEGQATAPTESGTIFYESFDGYSNLQGGNDGNFAAGSGTFKDDINDNQGWDVLTANAALQCIKLGSGSASGYATTPALGQAGNFTLTFKAAAWNNKDEKTTLPISISGDGASLSETSLTLSKTAWTEYTIEITGATAESKITFGQSGLGKDHRFFLDEVKIEAPSSAVPTESYTIPSSGLGTYCSKYPIDLTKLEGVKVYAVESHDGNKATLAEITDDNIKGGVGFVIEGEGGKTVEFNFTNSENKPDNELVGTLAPTYLERHTAYGLKDGKFQPNSAGTMRANRAYLPNTTNGVKALVLEFRDSTTGITHTRTLTNEEAEQIFNIAGQRMNEMQKGINIVGGKKVLVK